ncbi:hypothetical protein E2C01_030710 [Portunus trituberculatus]|uniref:Uncharacterized protein n=1 Tax=Portunus trituberculatus TaxID=210409 RepID=A0A5B7EVK3_PORTR|nr:hypothetical protein [Portunus trituberculatus]
MLTLHLKEAFKTPTGPAADFQQFPQATHQETEALHRYLRYVITPKAAATPVPAHTRTGCPSTPSPCTYKERKKYQYLSNTTEISGCDSLTFCSFPGPYYIIFKAVVSMKLRVLHYL